MGCIVGIPVVNLLAASPFRSVLGQECPFLSGTLTKTLLGMAPIHPSCFPSNCDSRTSRHTNVNGVLRTYVARFERDSHKGDTVSCFFPYVFSIQLFLKFDQMRNIPQIDVCLFGKRCRS